MWNFKSCPRCHGDVFVDDDIDKSYQKCLQCGYEQELTKIKAISHRSWHKEKAEIR
jgi:DNA-directed RNA polymerase subunit M/transcription elongation factor TFIIS